MSWPTWKNAEVSIAAYLSKEFEKYGLSPIKRIPILGREGPDLTSNELGLVVDVKHRTSIPKSVKINAPKVIEVGYYPFSLYAVRISDIGLIGNKHDNGNSEIPKIIGKWYEHIHEHQVDQVPDGIAALILHFPGTPYAESILLVHQKDWRKLYDRLHSRNSDS